MTTRPWLRPLFGRKSRPRPIRWRTRPRLEALESRLAPAVQLTYVGPGTVLSLLEQASGATPAVSISEPATGQLEIDLGASTFDPTSTAAAAGLTYEIAGSPATSHFADIDIGQANNITTLAATLPGDTLTLGGIADASGGLANVAASAGVININGLDTSHAGAGEGNVDLKAAGALTVSRNALLDTGTGTISLAADVNADGTGNSNSGELFIASGATVVSANASKSAITLRGAAADIDTSADPGLVGASRVALSTTPTAALTVLPQSTALAFDASGDLFVANRGQFGNAGNTISEFAPGSTTPTATLTGVSEPIALAFDAHGNLLVANINGTVSEFAPGSTTPTATLTGLNGARALAFDASGNLFVANSTGNTVSEFAPGSTTPTATLTGLNYPIALVFDARGDLFVPNYNDATVSEFAPGSTTPTAALTVPGDDIALAVDARGDLFVASLNGTTVSEFAPGSTTPTATLTGLNYPIALAFDARGDLFVANAEGNTVSEFAPGSTTPTATLSGLNSAFALAFDARGNLFVANGFGTTVNEFATAVPLAASGGVVIRTAQPGQSISVGSAAGTGLALSNAELAQIFTTASGAITFGDPSQTGTITFAAATPATTPGASIVAVQSGSGTIVLYDASGTALAAGTSNVSLTAGSGGIVTTGSDTAVDIATTGQVTLDTLGGVGSSGNPIVFDATQTPASVVVGDTTAPGSGVYLAGLGALTLGEIRAQSARVDVTAAAALTAVGAISAGNVNLTAAAVTVNAGASVTAGSADALSVTADTLTLLGTLSAGSTGIVTLKPFTTTRNIDLGGTGPITDLVLSDSALGRVTAGTLRIGDVTADTGDIDVTGSVSSHPGYATLSLQTQNGKINEANGATLTVANLALQAGSGIGTTGDFRTAVTNLAFANQSGAIHISNTGAVTLTNVDTLTGASIPGNIHSSSVVGSVYTLLQSSGGVSGQISYNGQPLAEGAPLVLADGNRYQISYRAGGGQDITLTLTASLHLGTQPVAAVAGRAFINLVVATFTDSNPNTTPPDFTAAIAWGDGYNAVTTVIVDGRGGFDVLGTHTYLAAGSYTLSVQVTDSRGATATGTGTATVAGADLLGQTIREGQSVGIGFWADAAGQALIRSFNGGPTSPALADWLAATLPNLYGAGTGPHDVTGLTNAQVAQLVRKLSRARASRPEAQVLATAMDVYATTRSLGGRAARRDGFRVTAVGLGATAVAIGARGAALGVRSQSVLDVDQILAAADERAVDAVLDDGNATLRQRADELFTEINTRT